MVRFERRLAGKIVAADPETAAEVEAERVREQFAQRTRRAENGTAGFYVRSTAGVIARIEASASTTSPRRSLRSVYRDLDQRRVKALVVLCNPARAVELLAAFAALRSRTLGDPLPETRFDVDHTVEYEPSPEDATEKLLTSRLENYGPLGRYAHRVKTHGAWTVRQPFHGIYPWRDPHGQIYLVDHTGTHKLTRPGTSAGPTRQHDREITIETHEPNDVVIDFGYPG